MAFQRMNIRHATKATVAGIVSIVPVPSKEWPAHDAILRISKLDLESASSITQDEVALVGGVSMSQLAAGNCDAFDTEKDTFWNRILDTAEAYWKRADLYPVIHGLKEDGSPDPNGKVQPFDRAAFSRPEMKCDVGGEETVCREISLSLTQQWKKAQP